jgi:hypothetical protein
MATRACLNLLLFIVATSRGFNAGHHQRGRLVTPRRISLSPLFFTDIEPEIRANTINFIKYEPVVAAPSKSGRDPSRKKPKIAVAKRKSIESEKSPVISSYQQKTDHSTTEKQKSYKSHRAIWQTRYNELRLYQAQNGHCMLPQSYAPNPKLGLWVMQQRRQYTLQQRGKKSSFDGPDGKKRKQLLDNIGFVWRVERRGPHGSIIGFRNRMQCNNVDGVVSDNLFDVNDFEKYMIERSEKYSDDDRRAAWRQRFECFR